MAANAAPFVILNPPKFGAACNGCGRCCQDILCPVAIAVFGSVSAPCPGLEFRNDRYWCSLIGLASEEYRAFLMFRMGIGRGCDSCFAEDFPDD